jgi:hypothetical protein
MATGKLTNEEWAEGFGQDAGYDTASDWLWSLRRRAPLLCDSPIELDVEDEDEGEADRLRAIVVEGFYAGVANELRGWLARQDADLSHTTPTSHT